METLRLEHVYKIFKGKEKNGDVIAVKDFNLSIEDNEFIVFVGPSGCGKSTTLRMIAGLEDLSYGNIYIDGQLVNKIEPNYRNIAMVFQNYALYPHMTAYQNMAFGLKNRKVPKDEIDARINEVAEILDIKDLLNRKPKAMSGGQRQRVALGRAIVRTPKIFLLDEPLSNLDAKLRALMRVEISKLYEKLKITFIYVTHDQVEAMTMGTRIVVMKKGVVQQIDTPTNLFDYPKNRFVAGFLGTPQMNFYEGILKKEKEDVVFSFSDDKIKLDLNELRLIDNSYLDGLEHKVILGVRPDDIIISSDGDLKAKIHLVESLGNSTQVYADFNMNEENAIKDSATSIVITEQGRSTHKIGEEIRLSFKQNKIHLFKDEENNEISIMLPPRSKRNEIVGYMYLNNEDSMLKIKTEEGLVISLKQDLSKINPIYKEGIHRVKVKFNDAIQIDKNGDFKLKYLGNGLLDDKKVNAFSLRLDDYKEAFYESNLHVYIPSELIKEKNLKIDENYSAKVDLDKLEIIGDDKLSIYDLNDKTVELDHYHFEEVKDNNIELHLKPNKDDVGEEIASRMLEKIEVNPNLVLGLATGSSPLPLYKELIKQSKPKNISFKNIKTFNLDEYVGLDAANNQSYRYFMNENLFKHLDFNKDEHYFPSNENFNEYDSMIEKAGGVDIQILGIGANGHIAFNEPNTPLESLTHITKLTKRTIKDNSRFFENIDDVPKEAITMGLSTILKSKEIYLIATGKNKAKAVSMILKGKYDPKYPASCLNLANSKVHIYVDEECFKALDKKALSKFELSTIK